MNKFLHITEESYREGKNPTMEPGTYMLPFSFQLPPKLPPTYASGVGAVQYRCLCKIDLPLQVDPVADATFVIASKDPLNVILMPTTQVCDMWLRSSRDWCPTRVLDQSLSLNQRSHWTLVPCWTKSTSLDTSPLMNGSRRPMDATYLPLATGSVDVL